MDGTAASVGRIDSSNHPMATRFAKPNTTATRSPGTPRSANQNAAEQESDHVAVGSQPSAADAIGAVLIRAIPPGVPAPEGQACPRHRHTDKPTDGLTCPRQMGRPRKGRHQRGKLDHQRDAHDREREPVQQPGPWDHIGSPRRRATGSVIPPS